LNMVMSMFFGHTTGIVSYMTKTQPICFNPLNCKRAKAVDMGPKYL